MGKITTILILFGLIHSFAQNKPQLPMVGDEVAIQFTIDTQRSVEDAKTILLKEIKREGIDLREEGEDYLILKYSIRTYLRKKFSNGSTSDINFKIRVDFKDQKLRETWYDFSITEFDGTKEIKEAFEDYNKTQRKKLVEKLNELKTTSIDYTKKLFAEKESANSSAIDSDW